MPVRTILALHITYDDVLTGRGPGTTERNCGMGLQVTNMLAAMRRKLELNDDSIDASDLGVVCPCAKGTAAPTYGFRG